MLYVKYVSSLKMVNYSNLIQRELSFCRHLYPKSILYALVNPAKLEEIDFTKQLLFEAPEHVYLYDIEYKPELSGITPVVLKLEVGSDFEAWFLSEALGYQACILFLSPIDDINLIHEHFSVFSEITKSNTDSRYYFEFYVPMTFNLWLMDMHISQRLEVFKPIDCFLIESERAAEIRTFSIDQSGARYVNNIEADGKTTEVYCYEKPMHDAKKIITTEKKPWAMSEAESAKLPEINRYNFTHKILRKLWVFDSIQAKHSFNTLWDLMNMWVDELQSRGITDKKNLSLFLALMARYTDEWKTNKDILTYYLNDTTESPGVRYLAARRVVMEYHTEQQGENHESSAE